MNREDYKTHISAKRAAEKTFDVELPSGAVWKLREPPIQQFMLAGKLPASLASKMAKVAERSGEDAKAAQVAMTAELTAEDVMGSLEFGRDLLLHCAVEPEISLKPVNDNQIAPEDIWPEDFAFLINWVLTGGKSGESLSNFR